MASGHGLRISAAVLLVAGVTGCGGGDDGAAPPEPQGSNASRAVPTADCDVTTEPSARLPKDVRTWGPEWYGDGDLYVVTQPRAWREPVRPDGSYEIKVSWFRRVAGELSVTARRLDGEGSAETNTTSDGYPETGPLPTTVTVSGPGCWELTGKLASTTTVAVLRVREPTAR
jgi:hypothetical protein